jgi:hypothetical protein
MTRTVLVLSLATGLLMIGAPRVAEAQRRQTDRITREEIEASPHRQLNIFELIRRTRPAFLEARGPNAAARGSMALYVDGRKQNGIDALKSIAATRVQDVVYFEPARAASEFGPQAASGAIVIKLRRDVAPD